VEEQFYLLWAPLFLLVLVARSWKTQLWTAVALLLLSALSRLLTTELAGTRQAFFLPWNRLDELLTGVVLALLISRHRAQVARYSGPVAAWASAAVLTVLCVAIPTLFDPRLGRGGFLGIALLSAVLVAHAETGTSTLNNLLSHPVSVWLGQRSYGFYLFHFPLVVLIRDHYGQRPLTVLLVVLPTTIVLSDLSFRFWEVPLRRRGRSPMTEAAR
jgi:peptidoglycan/LPS O-acetylase OafA/YrhL